MNPGCAAEQHAWREVKDGWRPLYGDVDKIGVAVEWHDFRTEHSFNWGRTFHPNSLEFCLNLDGHGAVGTERRARSDYVTGNYGYYAIADEPLSASRRARALDDPETAERRREFGGASGGKGSPDSLVPRQGPGTYGPFSFRAKRPGIFLYAAKTRCARTCRAHKRTSGS